MHMENMIQMNKNCLPVILTGLKGFCVKRVSKFMYIHSASTAEGILCENANKFMYFKRQIYEQIPLETHKSYFLQHVTTV